MLRTASALLLCFTLLTALGGAETPSHQYYLPGEVEYDPAIPTPGAFFGFEPGEWHLRHDQIVAYLREVAAASERMSLVEYGRSHEQKPLHLLKISHPDNLARAGEIQAARQRALWPEKQDGGAREEETPLVVWLGYSIHGNEPSGANAVPLLAYHLTAAGGPEIEQLLRETVILVDPVLNPDGLDRFAHWANTHRGRQLTADRNHREHQEAWPGARTNHYWFDLNRDWLPLVHPESRARMEKFHQWRPHLLGDFHEMGTDRTYFFQPGVPSRNNPLTPMDNYDLTKRISEYNARALDQVGSLYYTRETFDDFYVGKGSTYPDLNGAVGILFEQASSRGHLQESAHGPLAFPFTIRNQLIASLGTLEGAVALSGELKDYARWFYDSVAEEAEASPVQAYAVAASADPVRNAAFLDLLRSHQIRVHRLTRDVEINGKTYRRGEDFIVPLRQPQFRLIQSLFERRSSFEENVFYDVSTWVLPPAFNLAYGEIGQADFQSALLGEAAEAVEDGSGTVVGRGDYGYAFGWESFDAARALNHLLKNGLKAKVGTLPFVASTPDGPQAFSRGSIFVPLAVQTEPPDEVFRLMGEAAASATVEIHPVTTGLALEGVDLGSPGFSVIEEREVLVAIGDGISSGAAGEIWHLLDQRVEMAVSLVEASRLNRLDLTRYEVVVLPDGSYSAINDSGIESLERWVRRGGTLIAFQRAARWAASKKLAKADFVESGDGEDEERQRLRYGDADSIERLKRISGAIFSAQVDSTHPLGFGFEEESVQLFRQGTLFMKPSKNPYGTPVLYDDEPLVSGYISDENLEKLAASAAVVAEPLGSGQVILFADNVNFRGYWLGSSRLFLNAVFLGSAVRDVGSEEE